MFYLFKFLRHFYVLYLSILLYHVVSHIPTPCCSCFFFISDTMYKNFQYSFVSCCLMMVFIFFFFRFHCRQSAKKYLSQLSESQTSKKSYYLRLAWLIGELRNRKNGGSAFRESAIKSIWEKSLRLLETIRFCFCPHLAGKFIIMDFFTNFSLSHTHHT